MPPLRLLLLLSLLALLGCPTAPSGDDDDASSGDDDDAADDDDTAPSGYAFDPEADGPTATFCLDAPPAPPAGGALCTVEGSGNTVVFTGIVLGEDEVLYGGQVRVEPGGDIACVGCDCAQADATAVTCPFGVISAGLINAHDHISYTQNHPAHHGEERYQHRHDWRRGNNGHDSLSVSGGASFDEKAWGELRFALTGGTSINGSGASNGLLRNLDAGNEGLGLGAVEYQTFPLSDTSGFVAESGCDYPGFDSPSVLDHVAYSPHIAEGIDRAARNELLCLSSPMDGGEDLVEDNTAIIHAVGITAAEAAMMAADGSSVIWSPRSNIDLYGNTAPVTLLHTLGVNVGLGTDWTASGSMNVLRELACADHLNAEHYGGALTDFALWRMATGGGARALGVEGATGLLEAGKAADIALFDGRSHATRPFRAVIEAGVEDVWGTWRGGEPLAGEADLIAAVPRGGGCEELPMDVCGERKRVCLADVGSTFAALESANSGSYDLFACGEPDDEPSCLPFRPGEYDGPTASDQDGDGVDDVDDLCPSIFDPIRLLDRDGQADVDADGIGDVCDPCPLGEDADGCLPFDPEDRDGDGAPNDIDNCPVDANVLQNDTDSDGLGDVCDACPLAFNLPGENCAADVTEIKQGLLDEGMAVRVGNLLVTAVNEAGFFAQVPDADRDAALGAAWSGIFAYAPAEDGPRPAVGDVVAFDGVVNEWFGEWQLTGYGNPSVASSGNPAPAPLLVDPSDVATGGSLSDPYEGVLVRVEDVEVLQHDPPAGPADTDPTGEFVVSGGLRVNDYLTDLSPRPAIGDRVHVTGVLRFANDDSKIEPRSRDDVALVLVGPPQLLSLGPAQVFVYEGDVGASSIPPLMVTLDRPAPPGGTEVEIVNWDPAHLGAPATVTVPEGATSAEVLLDGLAADTHSVSLEAVLAPNIGEAEVTVLAVGAVPGVASLLPPSAVVPIGFDVELTLTLDAPAPPGGSTVALSADPGVAITLPADVFVPEGTFIASFDVAGASVGLESVTATLGASAAIASIEVTAEPPRGLILTEVLYDTPGTDDGLEWVELLNDSGADLDLSGWSVGGGGSDWTYSQLQLSGLMPAGACWVVGGPDSNADNGDPAFDLAEDFEPDLQNSGSTADGVALFDVPASQVNASTVPVDAVVYGGSNSSGLIGPDGATAPVGVGDAGSGSSIELGADGQWAVQAAPTPGDCSAAL